MKGQLFRCRARVGQSVSASVMALHPRGNQARGLAVREALSRN